MNMVKNKELSIEGALDLAQKEMCTEMEGAKSTLQMVRCLLLFVVQ